jgi:phosphate acetyltransferase
VATSLYLSTIEAGSGKSLAALGIIDFVLRKTTKVGFFRPVIHEPAVGKKDEDIDLILSHFGLSQSYESSYGLLHREVNELISQEKEGEVLDKIITAYKTLEHHCDFVLCEGTDFQGDVSALEFDFNCEIAKNLGCPVLIVGHAHQRKAKELIHALRIAVEAYEDKGCKMAGVFVNQVDPTKIGELNRELREAFNPSEIMLAIIPFDKKLASPRVREVAEQLGAEVLFGHSRLDGLVSSFLVGASQMQHAITWLKEDQLVITPGDRGDVILGLLLADQSARFPRLAGILLSTGLKPDPSIAKLIEGLPTSLPILLVKADTFTTASKVAEVHPALVAGDREKINRCIRLFEGHVDRSRLEEQLSAIRSHGMTPKMFIYNLVQQAKAHKKHIVLPEGGEPRILRAAADLLSRQLVDLTLLGRREEIEQTIKKHSIHLELDALNMISPNKSEHFEEYADIFYQVRKHKGMTPELARDHMEGVAYFGTMMVYQGHADGMVSGAIHTTQHTIRPALQIIKTKPDFSIVSSVFFMCLESGVVVYGDCAVNPNPNEEQLAEIAISSADTARDFGLEPRVALLSYSSGESGQGEDVEKVRKATQIARARRPDLKLEGPIQYDAAVDISVAKQKMPNSEVAGLATVFVFPDLNTGNNTYKAVQRETGAIAMGPILQGLRKPVNDLSRGCTVEDIVNTVIITAIQAQNA